MAEDGSEPPSRAFLTSLKAEGGGRGESHHGGHGRGGGGGRKERNQLVLESVPGAGPRIMELHDDLKHLAETLDHKVSAMLKEHEKDFFLAYKTHMYGVQKEFKALKQKADEEETKTRRDTKIQSLEKELEWFMTEALRLDELCKGYKKEVDKWKAKAEALDEDRRFLEDQIKGAKRQNKVLRAAVERAQSSAYSALMMNKGQGGNQIANTSGRSEGSESPSSPSPQRAHSHAGYANDRMPAIGNRSVGRSSAPPNAIGDEPMNDQARGMMPASMGSALALRGPGGQKLLGEEEQRLVDTIHHLKEGLDREQRQVRMLKAARANTYSKKSELEEFFLKCIDEARKDVMRKKHRRSAQNMGKKEKVLDVLLSSEDVLVFLYEKLFPHRTGMVQQLAQQDANAGLLQLPEGM